VCVESVVVAAATQRSGCLRSLTDDLIKTARPSFYFEQKALNCAPSVPPGLLGANNGSREENCPLGHFALQFAIDL
jgi:hypothetical protein